MKMKNLLLSLLTLCLVVGALTAPTLADTGYTALYSGYVNSGDIKTYNDVIVTYSIANGSAVYASVQSADYPSSNVSIPAGNAYYYYDALRIYVASTSGSTAYVDVSKPTSSSSTASSGTKITSDTPGQNALAGDKVTFPLTIVNNNDADKTYSLSSSGITGWSTSFQYNGKDTYQLFVPAYQSKTLSFVAQTAYDSPIGEKTIHVSTGDAGMDLHVRITSANQSATVSAQLSSMIANIGDKVYYTFSVENLQSQQNNYQLSVEGLPDNWDYQYKDSTTDTSQMAEVAVPADTTKGFVLQILPPVSVGVGDYNFTAVIKTPDNETIRQNLTLKLNSAVSMSVNSDKLAYSSQPGQTFNITVYVSNTGSGGSLTNVYPSITAPSGWVVSAYPSEVTSLKAGETQKFDVSVQSPGNIVASDYDVTIAVKSDQAQSSNDYRITITTSSFIPYIAVAIIVIVGAGLFFLYRKYGRR